MAILYWRYRDPGTKKSIKGYTKYVDDQVKNRRDKTGSFEMMDGDIIGYKDEEKFEERERELSNDNDAIGYLKYIGERIGSHGLFSSPNVDIDDLQRNLEERSKAGVVYLPIVSLKEKDAREYGLDTEAAWALKAEELSEEYRKALGISKENFHWMAAFHVKSPADQNLQSDAGQQPHLHFMIWEEEPLRRRYVLDEGALDRLRERTFNILSREFMQQSYAQRNELESKMKEGAMNSIEKFTYDVKDLILDIRCVMNGKGKLNVGELEKRVNIALDIYDAMESNQPLSQTEEYYKEKVFHIKDTKDAKRTLGNYSYIYEELNRIVDEIYSCDENKDLVDSWQNLSLYMRSAWGEKEATVAMEKDFAAIKRETMNAILKEAKDDLYDNYRISEGFRGMLYDKVNRGIYKETIPDDDLENATEVVAYLCKSSGMSEETALALEYALLERSRMENRKVSVKEIIEDVYKNRRVGLHVTSNDFFAAMRTMQTPLNKYDVKYRECDANGFAILQRSLLDPVYSNSLLTKRNYNSLLYKHDYSHLYETPNTMEDYENQYNNLLNTIDNMIGKVDEKTIEDDMTYIRERE